MVSNTDTIVYYIAVTHLSLISYLFDLELSTK